MAEMTSDVGILFSDIAGSTRLYELLGNEAALAAVNDSLSLMSKAVASAGGSVVKTVGDEVMAAFKEAPALFECAMQIQRLFEARDPLVGAHGSMPVRVRIGINFGSAIYSNGDWYGDAVNIAARMAGIAKGGQIMMCGDMEPYLLPIQRTSIRVVDRVAVKGKIEQSVIIEVVWQESSAMTMLPATLRLPAMQAKRDQIQLVYNGQRFVFFSDVHQVLVGREAENTIIVLDTRASRRHATIERRRDNWVIVDHSTNGTFVTFEGAAEIELRRQELLLHSAGKICFGQSAAAGGDAMVFSLVRA
jgi:class 3 adenylate cyclase